jgi:divalent metal cation (Fe/Co/Zn/Cd) transporter
MASMGALTVAARRGRHDNDLGSGLEIGFGGSNMLHVDKLPERCGDECCAPPPLILSAKPEVDRRPLVREAFRLEWITIGWMGIEAVVAIGSGMASGSLVLLAFGLDSVIELISAGMLLWRLSVELRHGQVFSENAERIAGRVGGALLFALAAYVVVAAGWNLGTPHHAEFSAPGFVVTLLAIPIMRYLATRKIDLANQLGSRALRTDAVESIACGWLSVVAVVSLGAQAIFGAWWIDSAGSLAILWFLVKEGREAWQGQCCADCE